MHTFSKNKKQKYFIYSPKFVSINHLRKHYFKSYCKIEIPFNTHTMKKGQITNIVRL